MKFLGYALLNFIRYVHCDRFSGASKIHVCCSHFDVQMQLSYGLCVHCCCCCFQVLLNQGLCAAKLRLVRALFLLLVPGAAELRFVCVRCCV
jgi:hypothetical protein